MVPALNYAHGTLSEMLAPALPGSVRLLEEESERKSWIRFLGSLPIMRKISVVSLVSLIAMVTIGLSPAVNSKVLAKGVLDDHGTELLLNLLFLLFAASVGAGFSLLFKLKKEIKQATFLPVEEGGYWTSWVMGIVAGFILSEIIPADFLGDWMGISAQQSKLVLALLGGFSAPVVYKILNLLVESVQTALKGGEARSVEMATRDVRANLVEQGRRKDMDLASGLSRLSQEVTSGADATVINDKIKKLLQELMDAGGEVEIPELPEPEPVSVAENAGSEEPSLEEPEIPEREAETPSPPETPVNTPDPSEPTPVEDAPAAKA